MLQAPALEVVLEFPLHALGQRPALRDHQVHKARIILLNDLVLESPFVAMPIDVHPCGLEKIKRDRPSYFHNG